MKIHVRNRSSKNSHPLIKTGQNHSVQNQDRRWSSSIQNKNIRLHVQYLKREFHDHELQQLVAVSKKLYLWVCLFYFPEVGDGRELDLALGGEGNGEVSGEGKVDGETQFEFIVYVPIRTYIPHQAHHHTVWNLHRHVQQRLLVSLERSRVLHCARCNHPVAVIRQTNQQNQ